MTSLLKLHNQNNSIDILVQQLTAPNHLCPAWINLVKLFFSSGWFGFVEDLVRGHSNASLTGVDLANASQGNMGMHCTVILLSLGHKSCVISYQRCVGIGCVRDDKMNKHCGSLERRHCVITALISHNPSIYNQPHSHSGLAPPPPPALSFQT